MGIGLGKGKTRAVDAALSAISSPLLDFPIAQATTTTTTSTTAPLYLSHYTMSRHRLVFNTPSHY